MKLVMHDAPSKRNFFILSLCGIPIVLCAAATALMNRVVALIDGCGYFRYKLVQTNQTVQAGKQKLDLLERLLIEEIDTGLFASGFKCASREQQERLLVRLVEHCLLYGSVHRTQVAHLEAMASLFTSLQTPSVMISFLDLPRNCSHAGNICAERLYGKCQTGRYATKQIFSITCC
jgi:hypothetical protein